MQPLLETAETVILGKSGQVRLAVACLLAEGHLLIEDLPGVGKTTLAHTIGRLLGLEFRRLQFTSDMLPADVVGASIYDRHRARFDFHPGPVFTQLLLADEVNRATPRTQSALLEAMEERQVTTEGETRPLPTPFFVVATQNPENQVGTFPLPESQLDRFLMRISIGYPDSQAERQLLAGEDRRHVLADTPALLSPEALQQEQAQVRDVHASDALVAYVQSILAHTRSIPDLQHGLSPRAGQALLRAARAWAHLDGRDAVLPEDVQAVFPSVAGHRLQARNTAAEAASPETLLAAVPVP
ncbi:AAA family ATPase [Aquisalimonas asiatica]|nr:AAA family ATPase [Aquisalimonas asiatica]